MINLQNLKNVSFVLILAVTLGGCWGKKDKGESVAKEMTDKAEGEVEGNAQSSSQNMTVKNDTDESKAVEQRKEVSMINEDAYKSEEENNTEAGKEVAMFNSTQNMSTNRVLAQDSAGIFDETRAPQQFSRSEKWSNKWVNTDESF